MSSGELEIRHENAGDAPILSQLAAEAFGPGRFARSAYRVREGIAPVAELSLCAVLDGEVLGGIRFTAISIGGAEGSLLLGPLIVAPGMTGRGFGRALIEEGLARAKDQGFALVLLVGDMPYYGRFGFKPVPGGRIALPGPVDPARLLYIELVPGAIEPAVGSVKGHARQ